MILLSAITCFLIMLVLSLVCLWKILKFIERKQRGFLVEMINDNYGILSNSQIPVKIR